MPARASACSGLSLGTATATMNSWVHNSVGSHRRMTASLVTAFAWLMMASHEGTWWGRVHNRAGLGMGETIEGNRVHWCIPGSHPSRTGGGGDRTRKAQVRKNGCLGYMVQLPLPLFLKEPSLHHQLNQARLSSSPECVASPCSPAISLSTFTQKTGPTWLLMAPFQRTACGSPP